MADDKIEIEDIKRRAEELKKLKEQLAALSQAASTSDKESLKLANEKIKAIQSQIASLESVSVLRQMELDALDEEIKKKSAALQQDMDAFKRREIERTLQRAEDERRNKQIQQYMDNVENLSKDELEHLKILIKQNKEAERRNKLLKEAEDLGTSMGKIFSFLGKSAFFNVDNMKSIAKGLFAASRNMENFSSAAKSAAISIATGLIDGFVNQIITLVMELNKAESSFLKATRVSNSFRDEMRAVYDEVRTNAVQMDQFYTTTGQLVSVFTDFTQISSETRQELAATTSTMVQAGHSADSLTRDLQLLTVSFGMLPQQANQTLMELDAFARDIGVPPSQLTQQFSVMGEGLAKLGKEGVESFKDLARVAKITGFELDKILKMTDRFDTFQGAAEQAGRLNAAIGGNFVNAMDLMTATDPVERFEMIRNSLLEAGLEFDNMSYYQRKFFAESLGLANAAELAAVMRGDLQSLDSEIGKNAASYEEMANEARRVANFQERFNAVLQKLIPIFDTLLEGIDMFLYTLEGGVRGQKNFSKEAEALQFRLDMVWMSFKLVLWFVDKMVMVLPALVIGFGLVAAKALLVKTGLIGLGAGGATAEKGLSSLRKGLEALGGASAAVAKGLAILAGFAGTIALMVVPLGYMAASFADMFKAMDIKKMKEFSLWLSGVVAHGLAMSFSNIRDLADSIMELGDALSPLDVDKLERTTNSISSMAISMEARPFDSAAMSLNTLAEAIIGVGDALDGLKTGKLDALQQISTIANSIKEIPTTAKIELIDAIKAAAAMPVVLGGAITSAKESGAVVATKGSSTMAVVAPLNVYLDGTKIVEDVLRTTAEIQRQQSIGNINGYKFVPGQ